MTMAKYERLMLPTPTLIILVPFCSDIQRFLLVSFAHSVVIILADVAYQSYQNQKEPNVGHEELPTLWSQLHFKIMA